MITERKIELLLLLSILDKFNDKDVSNIDNVAVLKDNNTYYNLDKIGKRVEELYKEFMNPYAITSP